MTRHIHPLFAPHVKSCIVDAEMVGWNPEALCVGASVRQSVVLVQSITLVLDVCTVYCPLSSVKRCRAVVHCAAATKGDQFDVKALRDGDDLQPCLVAFDCLALNGAVLSMEPLTRRVQVLKSLFVREERGRFMLADRRTVCTT